MSRRSLWGAWLLALVLLVVLAPGVSAAPGDQEPPPDEATPTGEASGEIEARVLIMRAGAGTDWNAIGGLNEGETVRVIGVSPDGRWLLIESGGRQGWVSADYVSVNRSDGLPVAAPPTAQPTLTQTPSPTPTATPEETNTPRPSATPTVEPTDTPSPTATDEPTATLTATQVVAAAPAGPSGDSALLTPTAISPSGISALRLNLSERTIGWIAVAASAAVLGLTLYLSQRGRRRRELMRYRRGYVIEGCPICQEGELHLEEHVQHVLGIQVVKRMVRCDNCRSVLRQIRPGRWRYTIDPLVNPALADEYNGHDFTDAQLAEFADAARDVAPREQEQLPDESPAFQEAVEHLAQLEASVLADDPLEVERVIEAADDNGRAVEGDEPVEMDGEAVTEAQAADEESA